MRDTASVLNRNFPSFIGTTSNETALIRWDLNLKIIMSSIPYAVIIPSTNIGTDVHFLLVTAVWKMNAEHSERH